MTAPPSTRVPLWMAAIFVAACASATRAPALHLPAAVEDAGGSVDASDQDQGDAASDAASLADSDGSPDAATDGSPCARNMVLVDTDGKPPSARSSCW